MSKSIKSQPLHTHTHTHTHTQYECFSLSKRHYFFLPKKEKKKTMTLLGSLGTYIKLALNPHNARGHFTY